jgi:16S rRNA (uracil1498-N3)-methyltransferase
MRRRFFIDRFEDRRASMRGEAAGHLGRVLRAEPGQLFELSDGQSVWLARVESVALPKRGENRVEFALVEPVEARESALKLRLLISVVKFERFEWCLEKATELGATEVVPLAATRADRPLVHAAEKRRQRWERILIESARQSRRLRPPVLAAMAEPADAFAQIANGLKIFLSERADAPALRTVVRADGETLEASLAFGPEGGWVEEEIAAARAAGFAEASLGETILRTETAVIAAVSVVRFALA